MLILPCPLSPDRTVNRERSSKFARSTLRNWRSASDSMRSAGTIWRPRLDAHGHHDGFVALVVALARGLDHRWIEIASDAENDLLVVEGTEHVEKVLRVETDHHFGTRVVDTDLVETVARLGAFAGDAHRSRR